MTDLPSFGKKAGEVSKPATRENRSFIASFRSECPECGWDVCEGDQAVYDDMDEVVHLECP